MGRLTKGKKLGLENFEQELKSRKHTYDDYCLKADLAAALGDNKLRSILYKVYYCCIIQQVLSSLPFVEDPDGGHSRINNHVANF